MKIEVAYAGKFRQVVVFARVEENSSIQAAIEASGILSDFPEIDLGKLKVGVFGKLKPLDSVLRSGDRVEIYRPVTADPAVVLKRNGADAESAEAS